MTWFHRPHRQNAMKTSMTLCGLDKGRLCSIKTGKCACQENWRCASLLPTSMFLLMVFFGKACARGKLLCKMTHVENGVRNRGVGVSGTPCFWNTMFSIWSSSIIIHFYDSSILWEYSGCFLKLTKKYWHRFFSAFQLESWCRPSGLISWRWAYRGVLRL